MRSSIVPANALLSASSLVLFLCILLASPASAQTKEAWQQVAQRSNNFYNIKTAFMEDNTVKLAEYEKDMDDLKAGRITQITKGKYSGIKQFMRLAEWYEPRVYESHGDMRIMQKDIEARINMANTPQSLNAANWALVGPSAIPTNTGNGRVNNVRVDPNNANILYACTPASQLFKSTDAGFSWSPISAGIPSTGVTDVAIDPTNTNILYAITGDGDQAIYHPYSAGLYKSTNGGTSWSPTGLSYVQGNYVGLTCIIIHPTIPNIILVGGTNGIRRSSDGGATFTSVSSTATQNLVFKPGDPNIVFAGSKYGGVFLRSVNNGVSFTQITSGLPGGGTAEKIVVDVSPANTSYVYAMATNFSHAMQGFYRSTDGGITFAQMATTPNIGGSQGWYDFAVAADPVNADIVYGCGIDVYKSINGGTTWTNMTNVYSGGTTHPDMHDLTFSGTSTLYLANDGGVYKTTNAGSTWINLSANLSIAQPYAIGLSASNPNTIITGLQDNGTILTNNLTSWRLVNGGDGMVGFIDWSNDNNMYASYQNGGLRRSINGGTSFSSATTGITGSGYWVTPYVQDPVVPATIYTGTDKVFKSVNGAASWTVISPTFGSVRWIEVDKNNTQVIFAMMSTTIQKTTNGGASWASASAGISGGLLRIHIDVNNSNTVYVTTASYTANSVYRSTDAGASWSLWATGLPNVPVNTIVTQTGSPGEVYCGTDISVHYRSASDASWSNFSTNLPAVPVRDLEIFYPTGKLRAGTFGRGVWETPLNAPSVCPFTYANSIAYVNAAATAGTNAGTSWANAYLTLDSAISVARKCDYVTQIWVAAGTYKPTTGSNRNISFSMVNDIAIYGGFAATGSPTFAQRNTTTNKTILSGDAGVAGVATDNSWHVISNPAGLNNTAILDGFIITDGYTDVAAGFQNSGGAVYNNGSGSGKSCSPRFANCVFKSNTASVWGGAVYNDGTFNGNCAAEYYNCIFESNNCLAKGGAVFNSANPGGNCNPIFTNCVFTGNNAATSGGAVQNDATGSGTCSPIFTHCSFQNNAALQGGALYNAGSTGTCVPVITSCVFFGNGGANTFINNSASIFTSYSLLETGTSNYTNSAGNALTAVSPFVLFTDAHLKDAAAAIDAGKPTGAPPRDLDSVIRSAVPDIGAYENLQSCIGADKSYWSDAAGASYQWQKNDGAGYVDIPNGTLYNDVTTSKLTVIAPANTTTGQKFRCRVVTGGGATIYSSENTLRFYNRWLGTGDNSWLNAANWSCAVLPNQYTDVIVPSAKTMYPLNNVSGTIRRLQAENGSSITVKTGSSLVIVGKD